MAVYLVGAPGAAPRLQIIDPAHAVREIQGGEVCVAAPRLGSWQISADGLAAIELIPSIEVRWMEVRRQRDALLAQSDWTQLPDVPPETSAKWQTYRQALRDITTTFASPDAVVWPEQP